MPNTTIRRRFVVIDLDRLPPAPSAGAPSDAPATPPATLRLNLFADAEFTAVVERAWPVASGYALRGRLVGTAGRFTLAVRGAAVTGTVLTPDAAYAIRAVPSAGNGRHTVSQVERALYPAAAGPPAGEEYLEKPMLPPEDAPRRESGAGGQTPGPSRSKTKAPMPSAAKQAASLPATGRPWQPVGPGPIEWGQVENVAPDNQVAGAIHTVLAHPTNADILYVGATNGGIWKTENATAANPSWRPLTDHLDSLSIGAMAFDPNDPEIILAGVGQYSSFGEGGERTGLMLTKDGGESWTPITDLRGHNISGVSIRGERLVVASGNWWGGDWGRRGVFRSNDGGATWTQVADGLPDGGAAMDLVDDPTNPDRLYASIRAQGVYRSDNGGVSWQSVSAGDEALHAVFTEVDAEASERPRNNNAEMAVANNGRLYLAVLLDGQARHIGYTDDQGENWRQMDLPQTPAGDGEVHGLNPRRKPGSQGAIHFSILAHPDDPNIVYVGGDRQDFPSHIGARDYTGRLFRGDSRVEATGAVPSPQWQHLTHSDAVEDIPGGGTASGSAPHADSREMVFDAGGNLVEVDDGGIYIRTSPTDNTGDWFSRNGNLQVTEIHDIAYDPVFDIVISGNQDTGTTQQVVAGNPRWTTVAGGDGGDVAVDASGWPSRSKRYSSYQLFYGFRKITYDRDNSDISYVFPTLLVDDVHVRELDPNFAFVQRFELNAVAPSRGVLGRLSLYETFDEFDTLTEVFSLDRESEGWIRATAYGCSENPDLLYVGLGNYDLDKEIWVRSNLGTDEQPTEDDFLRSSIDSWVLKDIVINQADCDTAYAIDGRDVFASHDSGLSWHRITGNLADVSWYLNNIEFIPPGLFGTSPAIVAVGLHGVYAMRTNDEGSWFEVGSGLPNAPVWDVDYDPVSHVLVVGTLGRGAWRLQVGPTVLQRIENQELVGVDESAILDLTTTFASPGDDLNYTVESSDPAVAAVKIANGSVVIMAIYEGVAVVTITATDSNGLSATVEFVVTVAPTKRFLRGWRLWLLDRD